MKEASSELSMTAVAVVAIAAISVVFTTLVWPNLKASITRSANCSNTYNCQCTGKNLCDCKYLDENGKEQDVKCPNPDNNNNKTKQ